MIDQSAPPDGVCPAPGDDDVIDQPQVKIGAHPREPVGQTMITAAWSRVTGRMIVRDDQRRGAFLNGPDDDGARIYERGGRRPSGSLLELDHAAAGVEIDCIYDLQRRIADLHHHDGGQFLDRKPGPGPDLLQQQGPAEFAERKQPFRGRGSDCPLQPCRGREERIIQRTKCEKDSVG